MLKVEIEQVSGGWLITVERDGEKASRRFTMDQQQAQDIAWTALLSEFDA